MNTFNQNLIEATERRKQLTQEAHKHQLLLTAYRPRHSITFSRRLVARFGDVLVALGNRLKLPETTAAPRLQHLEMN